MTIAVLIAPCAALSQNPREAERPRDPPSSIARSMCDALAGPERERCIAEMRNEPQREAEPTVRPDGKRTCDHLIGPERDLCLKKGGSVKAGIGGTRQAR